MEIMKEYSRKQIPTAKGVVPFKVVSEGEALPVLSKYATAWVSPNAHALKIGASNFTRRFGWSDILRMPSCFRKVVVIAQSRNHGANAKRAVTASSSSSERDLIYPIVNVPTPTEYDERARVDGDLTALFGRGMCGLLMKGNAMVCVCSQGCSRERGGVKLSLGAVSYVWWL